MDITTRASLFVFDLILPLAVGYGFRRLGWFSERFFKRLILFNVIVTMTILAGSSFWVVQFERRMLLLPFLGLAMQIAAGGVGLLMMRRHPAAAPVDRGAFLISAMHSNRGVMGVVTVFVVLGVREQVYALCQLVMVLAPLLTFGFTFQLAKWYRRAQDRADADGGPTDPGGPGLKLLDARQMPLLGIAAGILLNVMDVPRPEVLGASMKYLVHILAWFYLVPVGHSMSFGRMSAYYPRVAELTLIKFIITPIIVAALAWAVGLDGAEAVVVVILSASPTAIQAVVIAKLFDLNIHLAMAAFVLTMVVYLVAAVPAILLLSAWLM